MYYVYALQSIDDKSWLYIGYSSDLKERFKRHSSGGVRSTKFKLPLRLVYYEAYLSEKDARKRELQLKKHRVKSDLKAIINNSLSEI